MNLFFLPRPISTHTDNYDIRPFSNCVIKKFNPLINQLFYKPITQGTALGAVFRHIHENDHSDGDRAHVEKRLVLSTIRSSEWIPAKLRAEADLGTCEI